MLVVPPLSTWNGMMMLCPFFWSDEEQSKWDEVKIS